MVNKEVIRFVVGIIGNVISFGLFLSPLPTFRRIYKNKSVEEFSPIPYVVTVLNCLLWVFYGLPFNHPHSILVVTINGVGLFIEACYVLVFLFYGTKKHRTWIGFMLLAELVLFGIVVGLDLGLFHSHKSRSYFVGILCIVLNIGMYISPLTIIKKVIKTKSVEYMPLYLSVANLLNGLCWTAYALLRFDLNLLIPNGLGAVSGVLQLILYGIYYSSTPKKEKKNLDDDDLKKPSDVQLTDIV